MIVSYACDLSSKIEVIHGPELIDYGKFFQNVFIVILAVRFAVYAKELCVLFLVRSAASVVKEGKGNNDNYCHEEHDCFLMFAKVY